VDIDKHADAEKRSAVGSDHSDGKSKFIYNKKLNEMELVESSSLAATWLKSTLQRAILEKFGTKKKDENIDKVFNDAVDERGH
jgi:hypothetical protein